MLLNDMDISRLMIYAQKIEQSKIREIRKEGKRRRLDYSSHQKSRKTFYDHYSSMGNQDKSPIKNSQGGGNSSTRTRCPTCGKQHSGSCLAGKVC